MKKKAIIELSMNTLVITILGVMIIGLGLIFVTNFFDILPNQGVELSAPSFYDVKAIPSSGGVGTIFKIIVNVPETEKKYSVIGYVGEKVINFYDNGKGGDEVKNDGTFIGYWDSSSFNVGEVRVFLELRDQEGQEYKNSFLITLKDNSCSGILINGNSDEKIDLVVLGQDYKNVSDFQEKTKQYLALGRDSNGIFSVSPFKENIDKFNIYTINKTLSFKDLGCKVGCEGVDNLVCCNDRKVYGIASDCPYDKIIILINNDNFCGSSSEYSKVCTSGSRNKPMVLLHEFGHSFGGLGDEYDYGVYPNLKQIKNYNFPNCVSNCNDWPLTDIGCFAGCGYNEFFRSVERDSIMYRYVPIFNPISLSHLNSLLEKYSSGVFNENLPAPLDKKKYVVELSIGEKLESENVYVVKGKSADYKSGGSKEVKIYDLEGNIIYNANFDAEKINYPFYEEGSLERPNAFEEEAINFSLELPFYENADNVVISDSESNVSIDVSQFSDTCGNNICENYESFNDCPDDCDIQEDNLCLGLEDNVCDKDCVGNSDPDCGIGFKWLIWILGFSLIILVIIFFIKKRRNIKKSDINSQQNLNTVLR